MKVKDGFYLRSFDDKFVVVSVDKHLDFNKLITLNGTAAFIWAQLEKETTPEKVVSALSEHFQTDHTTALSDLTEFLDILRSYSLLEE